MIRRLARCIREYWWAAVLSPLCMIGEVAMEVTIPLVMKDLYDLGVTLQDMNVVVTKSIQLVLCALLSLAVLVVFVVFYNRLFAVTFDEDFARATGTRVEACNLLIAIVVAVIIVLAMNLVGSLLIDISYGLVDPRVRVDK